jgi:hypothetical protein
MNYIKQHQADKAEALDSASSIETKINDLVSYLYCDKFRVDTRVQVGDVLRTLLPILHTVTYLAANLSKATISETFNRRFCRQVGFPNYALTNAHNS